MAVHLRRKKLKDGRTSLYLDIYRPGQKREYRFLNLYLVRGQPETNREIVRLAEMVRAKTELSENYEKFGIPQEKKSHFDFVEAFQAMAEKHSSGGDSWISAGKHLAEFTGGKLPFESVNPAWLEGFRAYLESKVSRNSAHTYFAKFKAALRKMHFDGLIATNPAERVQQVKRQRTNKAFLTAKELERLARTPCKDAETKRAFLFACLTGLRASDVRALKWADVKDGMIFLKMQKTQDAIAVPIGRADIRQLMGQAGMPNQHVFSMVQRSSANKHLKEWCKTAGIEKSISFHCSRHTFATLALERGNDFSAVAHALGHSDMKTTQIYAKVTPSMQQNLMNSLPEIEVQQ